MTITTEQEQGFIQQQLLSGRADDNSYAIGGISNDTYKWAWTTGETFGYTRWSSGQTYTQPEHNSGENYLYIHVNYRGYQYNENPRVPGSWFNGKADWTYTGYICEWSTNNYIGTALVPDQNNNGVAEVAELFVDYKTGKHTVQIKDPATDKLLTTLVFATSFVPPSGLVVLKDTDANGSPEIGVLLAQYSYSTVKIKDIKTGKLLRDINFMTPIFKPKSVGIGADADGNGADEIVVLGINKRTGAAKAEIRDSKTGNISNDTPF